METLLVLLLVYLAMVVVVAPVWAWLKLRSHADELAALRGRAQSLEDELKQVRATLRATPPAPVAPSATVAAPPPVPPRRPDERPLPPPVAASSSAAPPVPPVPKTTTPATEPLPRSLPRLVAEPPGTPPARRPVYTPPPPPPGWLESINWEQFMGAKLFAWLGGLALFLSVAFFVKYSFEHNLIPPAVRVALGFLFGAGLIVGGLRLRRDRYAITAQTLVAAGVVSLYAVTFACHSIYRFEFFGPGPTVGLMALITATAFLLAVRLDAQVVAILGILGGFLTPGLISSGVDNPPGLFSYLALLDAGLIAVALHRRWFHLVPLGAAGTVLLMVGWAARFYRPEQTTTAMVVCLVFCAVFLGARELGRRLGRESAWLGRAALVFPLVALAFAWVFLGWRGAAGSPALIFGFVVAASLPLLVLAWSERAGALVAGAGAISTVLVLRWFSLDFSPARAPVLLALGLGFTGLYLGAYLLARRLDRADDAVLSTAVGMPAAALLFAWLMLDRGAVAARPGLWLAYLLAVDAAVLAVAWLDERLPRLHLWAGAAVFALLAAWMGRELTPGRLPWALAAVLGFAALHAVFPLVLERRRPAARAAAGWHQVFPPVALGLLLVPLVRWESVSLLIWPTLLVLDLMAVVLAALAASLLAVGAVLGLTLAAAGAWIFRMPATEALAPSLLVVVGGFAVFFCAAGVWLLRRLGDRLPAGTVVAGLGSARTQLPALSALLPFVLLMLVCLRLPVPDPSAVFGLGLLLVVLTLGLTRLLALEWLPACALAGLAALEYAWHSRQFDAAAAGVPLAWYAAFYAVFAVFPFLFRRAFAARTGPWAVAALSGVAQFWMLHEAVRAAWPALPPGVVPAGLALVPLGSLVAVLRGPGADGPARLDQLAWFGGAALLFITLVFPLQFDRQWLTVAWALEGAALLWLFHRVPHPGLPGVGVALLAVAFARLALNPAVLGYHVRGDLPLLNWYLYAYGVVAGALVAGARWVAPPVDTVFGVGTRSALRSGAVGLMFLLLNIEIADFFAEPGTRTLAFRFSGHFGRDMTYTIAWALFALGLLGAGLWRRQLMARWAGIALLGVALLKLFFHDLARLEALYRIGALFAVAAIAILASFAYQRFLPADETPAPPAPPP